MIVRVYEHPGGIMLEVFSLDAFILALRESMEASLIIGLIIATLKRIKADSLIPYVWIGTGTALVGSGFIAVLLDIMFGGLTGTHEKIFEGAVMLLAAFVLSYMIIWNVNHEKKLVSELQEKAGTIAETGSRVSLALAVFLLVFREGVELVLFFMGIRAQGTATNAILASGVLGVVVSVILAVGLFKGSVRLNVNAFFVITSVFLLFFSAGLFSHGIHEFQELGWFGGATNLWNQQVWDTSRFLSDSTDILGVLLRSLFGYQDQPSVLEVLVYSSYLGLMGFFLFSSYRNDERRNHA